MGVNNLFQIIELTRGTFIEAISNPHVYTLLIAAVVPLLTSLRDGVVGKWGQVTIVLGLGIVATVLNPPGDLTGIVLVAFALVLTIQYDLLGTALWPQLTAAIVLYGVFAVFAAAYFFKPSPALGFNYFIAAAAFVYLFWVVFADEVRTRRKNEQRLRESERRFETVIRNSNIMASNQDLELRYTWLYNPHAYFDSSKILGSSDASLFEPGDARRLETLKRRVIDSGKGVQEEFRATVGSQECYFDLAIEPLLDERNQIVGVTTASRDITERVLLRNRLVQSERFAVAGQLATYVAHEVNSPLQGISSLLDYMRKNAPQGQDLDESLALIHDAFDSIRVTVNNLLDLNRPTRDRLETVDLNEIIRATFALATGLLKKSRIAVSLDLSDGALLVQGFAQRFSQVFINLINNSVEAMSRGGDGSTPMSSADRWIRLRTRALDNDAVVELLDGGPGFTPEGLKHAFDPFQSKDSPVGMGIGLSICMQIVEAAGGRITAGNTPEGGARIRIELPIA